MADPPSPNGYLFAFEDGPLARRSNIGTLANPRGQPGRMVMAREVFGWPLPARLGVLCHEGVENIAFWNEDDPDEGGLPRELTRSPNRVVYCKVSESQLPDASNDHIMRGAVYRLEAK